MRITFTMLMLLLAACSSVLLGDSDTPPCLAACDLLYGACLDAGVVYTDDHADCAEQCDVRRDIEPGAESDWGDCILAGAEDVSLPTCEEALSECGRGACHDASSPFGDGGCGHY